MNKIDEIKNYVQNKYQKTIDNHNMKKMQKLLHIYFDYEGNGLSPKQIATVNNYISQNMVLSTPDEINNYTTYLTTMLSFDSGKEKLAQLRNKLANLLINNQVLTKEDACLIAENLYIHNPEVNTFDYSNGEVKIHLAVPEKKYVVHLRPNTEQGLFTTKYKNFTDAQLKEYDNAIQHFEKVENIAFTHIQTMGL